MLYAFQSQFFFNEALSTHNHTKAEKLIPNKKRVQMFLMFFPVIAMTFLKQKKYVTFI